MEYEYEDTEDFGLELWLENDEDDIEVVELGPALCPFGGECVGEAQCGHFVTCPSADQSLAVMEV